MGAYLIKAGTKVEVKSIKNKIVTHILKNDQFIPKEAIVLDPVRLYNLTISKFEDSNFSVYDIDLAKRGYMIINLDLIESMKTDKWKRMYVQFTSCTYI